MDLTKALAIQGWMSRPELAWLAEQASYCGRVVEVGCWKGRSTRALGDHCTGEVWAVDTWAGSPSERDSSHQEAVALGPSGLFAVFSKNLADLIPHKVKPLQMPSQQAAAWFLNHLGGMSVDMVFIDGDHRQRQVEADITSFLPLLRVGGLLCGHDYQMDDVRQAVTATLGQVEVVESIWCKRI